MIKVLLDVDGFMESLSMSGQLGSLQGLGCDDDDSDDRAGGARVGGSASVQNRKPRKKKT
jgi:hypothetical protein